MDDEFLEDDEVFYGDLAFPWSAAVDGVTLAPDQANAAIVDDDCKPIL